MLKKLLICILFFCLSSFIFADGTAKEFNYDGHRVTAKTFFRQMDEYPSLPLAHYNKLFDTATEYKKTNPDRNVVVHFAIYNINAQTYDMFDHIVAMVESGVQVNMVSQSDMTNTLAPYIEKYPNLQYRYVTWGVKSEEQMHSKFVTMSIDNTVYVSSSNVDGMTEGKFKNSQNRCQSGLEIAGCKGLYDAFNRYFDIIFNNNDNQIKFREDVRKGHSDGILDYEDKYFHTHFTPVLSVMEKDSDGTMKESAWDTEHNMFARYLDEMSKGKGPKSFFANVYHYKLSNNDLYGWKMFNLVKGCKIKEGAWLVETSTNVTERFTSAKDFVAGLNEITGGNGRYFKVDHTQQTHCKDMLLSYKKGGKQQYVTITGSTNFKMDGNAFKSNASIAVTEDEKDHKIYDSYKEFINSLLGPSK